MNRRIDDRQPYRSALECIDEISSYLDSFQSDSRPGIVDLVSQTRKKVAEAQTYLEEIAELAVTVKQLAKDPKSVDINLLHAQALVLEPEYIIPHIHTAHNFLFLLRIADALPANKLKKLGELMDSETPSVWDLAGTAGRLDELISAGVKQLHSTMSMHAENKKYTGSEGELLALVEEEGKNGKPAKWTSATDRAGDRFGITGSRVRQILRGSGYDSKWFKSLRGG